MYTAPGIKEICEKCKFDVISMITGGQCILCLISMKFIRLELKLWYRKLEGRAWKHFVCSPALDKTAHLC